jgi:cyclopropane fatty-acyl-phospholipid synthase-like methyltransferase
LNTIDQLISYALKGDSEAIDWFYKIRDVLHFWDDLIDGDKPINREYINQSMFTALVDIPACPFFIKHRDSLQPVLVNAIANWHAANAFEHAKDDGLLDLAYVVRSDYANLLIHSAYLVGGHDWMLAVTPSIRKAWTSESLTNYKANLQREVAQRNGTSAELVQSWYEQETDEYLKHGLTVFNAAMLDKTEEGHARALAEMIYMTDGQTVIDMGCGVGGVSRLMKQMFPESKFYGVTNVKAQIEIMQKLGGVTPIFSDYHNPPIESGFADVVMFNESIGYGNLGALLKESFRLLKQGGALAIKDGVSLTGSDEWSSEWQWVTFAKGRIDDMARQIGFVVDVSQGHEYSVERYEEFIRSSPLMSGRYTTGNIRNESKFTSWFWILRKP